MGVKQEMSAELEGKAKLKVKTDIRLLFYMKRVSESNKLV